MVEIQIRRAFPGRICSLAARLVPRLLPSQKVRKNSICSPEYRSASLMLKHLPVSCLKYSVRENYA